MLYEVKHVKQDDDGTLKRWFTDDDYFDLFVWIINNEIIRFQLCYDKIDFQRVLTWDKSKGFSHEGIDDGEVAGKYKRSPILVMDGLFDVNTVPEKFKKESVNIDPEISNFVYNKIKEYKLPF